MPDLGKGVRFGLGFNLGYHFYINAFFILRYLCNILAGFKVNLNGKELEEFKYLGSTVQSKGKWEKEVKKRV